MLNFNIGSIGASKMVLKVIKKLEEAVLGMNFGVVSKIYKQVSREISYFLSYLSLQLPDQEQIKNMVFRCMNYLKILVDSTEYQKYSHRFPVFEKLLEKFNFRFTQVLFVDQEKVLQIIHRNQTSSDLRLDLIEPEEIEFLKLGQANSFFCDLMSQRVLLHNPECICCSQVFINNFKTLNKDHQVYALSDFTGEMGQNQINFQNYLSAVLNQRGRVIILGMQQTNQYLIAKGIKFNTMEQIERKQAQINLAISKIIPVCQYQMQRVLVHTNYMNPTKISEEYMRVCFRIKLFPAQPHKINYTYITNKAYHKTYQVFKFDAQRNVQKILSRSRISQNRQVSLYTIMHEAYRSSRERGSLHHPNIRCLKPYPEYSQLFIKHYAEGFHVETQPVSDESIKQKIVQEEPKFKFKHVSLLITDSEKVRYIDEIRDKLIKSKETFQITQPFSNYFKHQIRSVQVISHQINFILLKNYNTMPKYLVMMPVYCTLEIENSKYNENKGIIQGRFRQRYSNLYDTEMAEIYNQGSKKTVTYLHFQNISQAIYTYMLFEELQLRPYFTKDGFNKKNTCKN